MNTTRCKITLIVVAYNMQRELPRTLYSLSLAYQKGALEDDYEVIVVDNGSNPPLDRGVLTGLGFDARIIRVQKPEPSPVKAINEAVLGSVGDYIGIWIDGARIASPGIFEGLAAARALDARAPVLTLGFHLGPKAQQISIQEGYNQEAEDQILRKSDWRQNGYNLFDICARAQSTGLSCFSNLAESNGFFLPRWLWDDLRGFEERFSLPGGGLANLDLFARMLAVSQSKPITLLGEGTFHQFHGGVSTNVTVSPWAIFADEYREIRGKPYKKPQYESRFLGSSYFRSMEQFSRPSLWF